MSHQQPGQQMENDASSGSLDPRYSTGSLGWGWGVGLEALTDPQLPSLHPRTQLTAGSLGQGRTSWGGA